MAQVNVIDTPVVEARAARLVASIERGERQLRELESNLVGALRDHDTIQEDQNSLRALREAVRFDVTQARRALARLADGSYGLCRTCNCRSRPSASTRCRRPSDAHDAPNLPVRGLGQGLAWIQPRATDRTRRRGIPSLIMLVPLYRERR